MDEFDKLANIISSLLAKADEVLKLADLEWQDARKLQLRALALKASEENQVSESNTSVPSDWVKFRAKYESWYRSCLGLMDTVRFSGVNEFRELYLSDRPDLPSIRTALLMGFSVENYWGFSDRMENQIAILSSLKDEAGYRVHSERRNTEIPPRPHVNSKGQELEGRLVSGRTVVELYSYLRDNGGSYNDLRVCFHHNGLEPHSDVDYTSTRNRDRFLDEYIQPLQLTELSDVERLVRFIEQVVELPDGSVNPQASKLLSSLQQDGWQVAGSKITLSASGQIPEAQDAIQTMPSDVEKLLEVLIKGMPRAMYPLKHRRKGLPFFQFNNEYDVQDLMHSLLRPWVKDVRPEEYTPSYAGSSTRIDFVIPNYNIVIEVKYVRDNKHAKKIGDELIIDIAHYKAHPQCKQLWIVIYDPHRLIRNPEGLASDLGNQSESIQVRTFVV